MESENFNCTSIEVENYGSSHITIKFICEDEATNAEAAYEIAMDGETLSEFVDMLVIAKDNWEHEKAAEKLAIATSLKKGWRHV